MTSMLLLTVTVGFLLPVQTAINSRLRVSVKSTFAATLVAFIVGSATLGAIVALRHLSLTPTPETPWWAFTGGILGAAALLLLILIFPIVGAVESVILPLIGKVITGITIDHLGWMNSPVQHISLWRVVGLFLVLAGVYIATMGRPSANSPVLHWRLVGIFIGVLSALQVAVNGRLTVSLGSSISSGFISYLTSTAVLLVVVLALRQFPSHPSLHPWWMWCGGPLGAAFVVGLAGTAPVLGLGVALLLALFGQILGSSAIDHFGWFSAARTPITVLKLAGIALLAAGMTMYSLY